MKTWKNWKRWIALGLTGILLATTAGCGDTSNQTTQSFTPRLDTEQSVTINIIGNMGNFEALEAAITDFSAYYPNCEVLYSCLDGDYWTSLELRLKSDDSVGIFMMDSRAYTTDFMKETCADLSAENIDFSAVQSEVVSSATVDGKLYEIPIMHNASGLIVNETLLEEQGLSIPTNYSELLATCEALKEAGYTPIQGYEPTVNSTLMCAMSYVIMNNTFKNAAEESLEQLEAGEEGSAEQLQPVFDVLNELYQEGYIDQDVNLTYADSYNESILKFFEGDVPFLVGTTETMSGMAKRESKSEYFTENPFEYAFMTTPFAEDGAYCYLENWYGFSVNENCSDKEWAVEFLRFLMTEEELNQLSEIKGLPSVAVGSENDERFIGLYTEDDTYRCTIDTFFPQTVNEALYVVEKDLVNGKITLDEATSEVERRLRDGDFEE